MNGFVHTIASGTGRMRLDINSLIAWTIRLDSGQRLKHPFADGAKGVVRKRIHGCVVAAKGVLFRVAIPAFPDGGGTVGDFVAPRGEFARLN